MVVHLLPCSAPSSGSPWLRVRADVPSLASKTLHDYPASCPITRLLTRPAILAPRASSAWNALSPDTYMAHVCISSRSPLKCHPLQGHSLTSPMPHPAPPSISPLDAPPSSCSFTGSLHTSRCWTCLVHRRAQCLQQYRPRMRVWPMPVVCINPHPPFVHEEVSSERVGLC